MARQKQTIVKKLGPRKIVSKKKAIRKETPGGVAKPRRYRPGKSNLCFSRLLSS
jgi:hypothetical protein